MPKVCPMRLILNAGDERVCFCAAPFAHDVINSVAEDEGAIKLSVCRWAINMRTIFLLTSLGDGHVRHRYTASQIRRLYPNESPRKWIQLIRPLSRAPVYGLLKLNKVQMRENESLLRGMFAKSIW